MNKPTWAYVLFLCLCFTGKVYSQPTTLAAGDISFIGYNCTDNTINGPESNDDFVFVLLKAVKTGTIIYFTDFGWCNTSASGTVAEFQKANTCGASTGAVTDGILQWKATTDLPYGTRVAIRPKFTPRTKDSTGTISGVTPSYNLTNGATQWMSLATSGESLFAYQGTATSPTLIAGININVSGWDATLDRCLFASNPSTLPAALNTNNYAFTLNYTGNGRLRSGVTLTGNPVLDRTIISTPANWEFTPTGGPALEQPAPGIILPLKLVSFTGAAASNKTILNWKVTTETDVDGYSIEGSNDGMTFRSLGFAKARNTPASEYAFTTNHSNATSYYRLKVLEKDGRNWFSSTVVVKADKVQMAPTVTVKPDGVLLQTGTFSSNATAVLLNSAGVAVTSITFRNGIGLLPWNNAPAGNYIVVYTDRQVKQTYKAVKLP